MNDEKDDLSKSNHTQFNNSKINSKINKNNTVYTDDAVKLYYQ